jgi:hypothetical protein
LRIYLAIASHSLKSLRMGSAGRRESRVHAKIDHIHLLIPVDVKLLP